MSSFPEIAGAQVLESVTHSEACIIDVRSVNAYNGWRENNEFRGGHIPSARSVPSKWADYIDWPDIVAAKGILPERKMILYGQNGDETEKVAHRFRRAGYEKVQIYPRFISEWCTNPEFPLNHLPRYRQLVSAEWLKTLLDQGNAPEFENDKFVVCHAHYRNRSAYDDGHIPGAIELDTNILESPETWNRRSPGELKQALEETGITADTTVILYGRFAFPDNNDPFPGSSAGHLGAMRCAFIMMYAGVRDVRVLNGGLQAWHDAGFEPDTEKTAKRPVADFGVEIPQHPEFAVDMAEAKQILAAEDKNLVCVRSWREYIGEVSGYNYIEKKGRIPGAVFGNCGSDAYHMENYRNLDHTTREYHELRQFLAEVNVTAEMHNAFYCGTGWRGSEAFFNAWLMGWPRVSVFDGGWFEWSNDSNNPYETGIPQPEAVESGSRL